MSDTPQTWTLDDGTVPEDWRINKTAAISRFQGDEWPQIDLYAIYRADDIPELALIRAHVRTLILKITTASYVWLQDPAFIAGVNLTVSLGFLTEARADEILNTPPALDERL